MSKRKLKPEFRALSAAKIMSRKVREAQKNLVGRIEDIPEGEALLIRAKLKRRRNQTTPNYLKKETPINIPHPQTQQEAVEWQTYGPPFLNGKVTEAIPMRARAFAFAQLARLPQNSRGYLSHLVLSEPLWSKDRHRRITTPIEILEGQRIFAVCHQKEEDITAHIYCDPDMAPEAPTKGGKAIIEMPSRYLNGDPIKFTRWHLPVEDNEFKFAIALLYATTGHTSGFEFNFLNFSPRCDPITSSWMVINRYDVAGELAIVKQAKHEGIVNSHGHPVPLEMILFPIFNQPQIEFYKRLLDSVAIQDTDDSKPRRLQYCEMVRLCFERMLLKGYYSTSFARGIEGKVEDQNWKLRSV